MPARTLGGGGGVFDAKELEPCPLAGADVAREQVARCRWRPERLASERHPRFVQGPAALLVVAALAGRHDVLPGALTTTVPRDHVVEREVVAALAAVLAGVVVANEDFLARHLEDRPGALDVVREPNDRRRHQRSSFARDDVSVLLDDDGLLLVQEDHSAAYVAYV